MAGHRLIVDLGGTNARFAAAAADGGIGPVTRRPLAAHGGVIEAMDAAMAADPGLAAPASVAIGAAGPVDGDRVALTNAPWIIEAGAVSAHLGGVPVRLLNDLEAVARALPAL